MMSTQSLAYSIVDAFASTQFKGNPAAVIVLEENNLLPDSTLQNIGAEFNLSETAFITPIEPSKGRFGIRWFTPTREAAICGHATLASARVLFSELTILPGSVKFIEFETVKSGVLTAKILPDGRIELEFPVGTAVPVEDSLHKKVRELLPQVFEGNLPSLKFVGTGGKVPYRDYLVLEIDADYDLDSASVTSDPFVSDFVVPGTVGTQYTTYKFDPQADLAPQHRVIIVTQRGQGAAEFRSRVFCPTMGIPEDPVTGSAHSVLGPYWATQLQVGNGDEGETELTGRQVSKRSGEIGVVVDRQTGICRLRGQAILVGKGEIYLPN